MRTNLFTTAMAAAALTLSACGADGGTGPAPGGGGLSAAEAAQLNQAILGVSAGVRENGTPPVGERSGSMGYGFNDTAPCQPGGNVGVQGDMDIAWNSGAGTSSISTDFAVKHNACAYRMENGDVVTLTGDPDIDVSLDVATGPSGLASFTIRETGAFNWSRDDGYSGRCSLDVTAQLKPGTRSVTLSGSFCGIPVTGTFPVA